MNHSPNSNSPIRPLIYAADLDVTDLNAKADSPLPTGFQIEKLDTFGAAIEIYVWNGSEWEDGINGGVVRSTSITGVVLFANTGSVDVDFTW